MIRALRETFELTPDSPVYHTAVRYLGDGLPPYPETFTAMGFNSELQQLREACAKNEQVAEELPKWLSEGVSYECLADMLVQYGGRMYPLVHRDWLVTYFAWAIPSPAAVQFSATLSQKHPICEIGAGNGYWAHRIHEMGGNVTAYDNGEWKTYDRLNKEAAGEDADEDAETSLGIPIPRMHLRFKRRYPAEETHLGIPIPKSSWFPVMRTTAAEVEMPPDSTLFLCWPPIDEPMATECLNRFEGEHLIYVGETSGGCCADDAFFEALGSWKREQEITIPRYYSIKDVFRYYRR